MSLIKAITTRTIFAYVALGVVLALTQVLVTILASSSDLDSAGRQEEAIGGLPLLVLLLGIVGAAGEYRHRTVAPAALVTGRDAGQMLIARAGAYAIAGVGVAALATSSRSRSACRCWRVSPVRLWVPATSRSSPAGACSPRRCRGSSASRSARSCATRWSP